VKPRALIVGDRRKPGVRAGVERSLPFLSSRLDVAGVDLDESLDLSREKADLVLIFGGDGSFLYVANRLGTNPLPVLGVNYGRFGFLSELQEETLEDGIERFLAGRHVVSERMRLRVRLGDGRSARDAGLALNDVVVGRDALGRMVEIDVRIDDREAISYAGDGVIVATPTGSTAYALASGGPIVEPSVDALVLVPLCPHALGNRPLLVPGRSRIEMRVRADAALAVDGRDPIALTPETSISVEDAHAPLRVVSVAGRSLYDSLREKLGWAGRPNYRRPREGDAPPAAPPPEPARVNRAPAGDASRPRGGRRGAAPS
jgi:NAD+ kinase